MKDIEGERHVTSAPDEIHTVLSQFVEKSPAGSLTSSRSSPLPAVYVCVRGRMPFLPTHTHTYTNTPSNPRKWYRKC